MCAPTVVRRSRVRPGGLTTVSAPYTRSSPRSVKLYASTSDKDGVRHAVLDQSTISFAEAKFMLLACSAFVNFVLEAASARGSSR
jgi:hypothetical protein